jgi:drug/metabolite transporter (DMT)-like permease
MPLNLIRLVFAMVFISLFTKISGGHWLPLNFDKKVWFWLSLSGFAGFFIGDLCLFRAFVTIGSRVTMLIYSLATPMAATMGYFIFAQKMSSLSILGMIMTLFGIALVVFKRGEKKVEFKHPVQGVLLAVLGALGQASGLVLSKMGMSSNPTTLEYFSYTQIRIIAAIIGFMILFVFTKSWARTLEGLKNRTAMIETSIGAIFGPFIGVTLALVSIAYISLGVSSTITAIVPVVIIIPHVVIYKEKVELREILGAFISVLGVSLLFV